MTTSKDIGFFRKLFLIFLTKLQEITLKSSDRDMYLKLTKLHFKTYFKKNLFDEFMKNSREYKAAQERHGRMVVSLLYPDSTAKSYRKRVAKATLSKDLALEIEL